MIVELLARPELIREAAERLGYIPHPDGTVSDGDELIEVCGRVCYRSWKRPNPGTATNGGYLRNITNHKHFSIMEHAKYVFAIQDVSRALTHELVRHRHLSFSQESQRYVDASDGMLVVPADLKPYLQNSSLDFVIADDHAQAVDRYNAIYSMLIEKGVPHKRARQAARYVLPHGHTTTLIVSGNVRAWREVIQKRTSRSQLTGDPEADLEINELATRILMILHEEAPNSVHDLWDEHLQWQARDAERDAERDRATRKVLS